VDAVSLLVLQRKHPVITEAAVDSVPHEGEFHHLSGEISHGVACRPSTPAPRLADRQFPVAE
jgi:hypothetical protein